MKFKHIADYLLQPDIAGALICCQLEMTLGRRRNAHYGLIKLFKRLNFNATVRADVNSRGRERILGEAAVWLADSFLSESKAADGVALFRQLLTKNPRADPLYRGLCRLVFPGDNYVQILKALHREFKPKFYVEIGVNKGDSLLCVMPSTDAVGIDPNPRIARAISRNIAIFPETSDAFFAAYKTRPQFYGRKIDFAYIDGLHHFEQALRDFINIEKRAAIGGMIALHDCIPFDEINSGRDYDTLHWVGDVWKTLAVLLDHRPELNITIIGAPPSGLVLVRHLVPSSRILEQKFDSIVDDYFPLQFTDWEHKYAPRLRIVQSHAEDVVKMLASGS